MNKDTQFKFEKSGIYAYWCTPHKMMGMIGIVIVDDDYKNLDLVKKTKMIGKSKKILKQLTKELK
jgi:FtsP/CotA-like multicopper oxidase with cupredoxin domain